jgi:hypothetical protein
MIHRTGVYVCVFKGCACVDGDYNKLNIRK